MTMLVLAQLSANAEQLYTCTSGETKLLQLKKTE